MENIVKSYKVLLELEEPMALMPTGLLKSIFGSLGSMLRFAESEPSKSLCVGHDIRASILQAGHCKVRVFS